MEMGCTCSTSSGPKTDWKGPVGKPKNGRRYMRCEDEIIKITGPSWLTELQELPSEPVVAFFCYMFIRQFKSAYKSLFE